ncbi:MAG: sodium:proton antiporter [Rickettsiales bacterium]|nr:sodium:proton antiporter [Rickettsiales bacterium]OUV83614.1 MAG: sodium:proton antiporter [Rickettsiales bacterium TMED131]
MNKITAGIIFFLLTAISATTSHAAAAGGELLNLKMILSGPAIFSLATFVIAYFFVMTEEFSHLRKSKPVVIASGVIWMAVAITATKSGVPYDSINYTFRHVFLEFAELFMFLLVAMTFINTMTERNVFEVLRAWLVNRGFDFRKIFIITGILSFFISPIADNLTTALLMCAVVMAVAKGNKKFICLACINIVIAANAGGAFSPFGDITTLMVWQKGVIPFFGFFSIFIPSAVNYIIPAVVMYFAIPKESPKQSDDKVKLKEGALISILLFLGTITLTVISHQKFHMPTTFGMISGLGVLSLFGFYLKKKTKPNEIKFDIFTQVGKAEWDTLFFFYGVLMCVGGLSAFGYLAYTAEVTYIDLGPTFANVLVGILSAIVDNIPVMYAVLTMFPAMDEGQWLLATLTAGVGGSMLSIGSAAGVALMGQSKGNYTFFGHLKWTPVIALGYAASIYVHILYNADKFDNIPIAM